MIEHSKQHYLAIVHSDIFFRYLMLLIVALLFFTVSYSAAAAPVLDSAWVDIKDYKGELAAAIEAARGKRLLVSTPTKTIWTSLTVPTDVQIEVVNGGMITLAHDAVITINGSFVAALHQVFGGDGKVLFGDGSVREVYPEWWGVTGRNDEKAINAAINSVSAGDIILSRTYYIDNSPVEIHKGIALKGVGRGLVSNGGGGILFNRRAKGPALFIGGHVYHISIENIGFRAAVITHGQYGIEMAGDPPNYSQHILIRGNHFFRLDKGIYAHELTYSSGWECDYVEIDQNMFDECNTAIYISSQNCDAWKIANNKLQYFDTGVYLDRSGFVTLDTNAGAGVKGIRDNTFIKVNIFGPLAMINNQAEQTDWFFRNMSTTGNPNTINLIGNTANAPCKIVGGGLIINSIGNYYSFDFIVDSGNTNITSTQDNFSPGKKFVLKHYSQITSLISGATVKSRINSFDDQFANSVREKLITNTTDTVVASLTPWDVKDAHLILYKVHYYYRVVKADTDVRIHLEYNDGSGYQDIDLVPAGKKAVGSYPGGSVTIGATTGTGTGKGIFLKITAGTPNQVYVSATIEPITY